MSDATALPAALPVRGSRLAGLVVATQRAWQQTLPASLDVDGEQEDIGTEDAAPAVRGQPSRGPFGDLLMRVLRRADRLWVVQHIADLTGGSVVVIWAPSGCPRALAILQRLPQRARWPVVIAADGTRTVPALTSDGGTVATAVKAAWPTWWRRRRASDSDGDPLNGTPAAPPTGALIVGAVIE